MIGGPYGNDPMPQGYLGQLEPLGRSYPPGESPSAIDIARKEAYEKQAMKAERSHELSQIAQSLEHLRHRLLFLDLPANAHSLDIVIVDLMQRWVSERSER